MTFDDVPRIHVKIREIHRRRRGSRSGLHSESRLRRSRPRRGTSRRMRRNRGENQMSGRGVAGKEPRLRRNRMKRNEMSGEIRIRRRPPDWRSLVRRYESDSRNVPRAENCGNHLKSPVSRNRRESRNFPVLKSGRGRRSLHGNDSGSRPRGHCHVSGGIRRVSSRRKGIETCERTPYRNHRNLYRKMKGRDRNGMGIQKQTGIPRNAESRKNRGKHEERSP